MRRANSATRIHATLSDTGTFSSYSEVQALGIVSGSRMFTMRHDTIMPMIQDYIDSSALRLRDALHAMSHNGLRYLGLFQITGFTDKELDWVIAATNANDGFGGFDLVSGFCVPDFETMSSFHEEATIIKRKTSLIDTVQVKTLVNEKMGYLRDSYLIEYQRMAHYKSVKLTEATAHHFICKLLSTEIVAGRSAHEFITTWDQAAHREIYIKPRTMWSLFCHANSFLARLKHHEMIERSMELHTLFDALSNFHIKPNQWLQSTLI